MAQSQFSLCWDDHSKNICNGLSYLQQNGEFVDMTLAADGHLVKVHQVIMALSSPFLKDLIASAQCPHPVIILNKISHKTLSAILEYIYTGEVLVAFEEINELVDAAKDLHIKGLQEMNLSPISSVSKQRENEMLSSQISCLENEEDACYFEITKPSNEMGKDDLETESVIISDVRCINDADIYEMPITENKSLVSPGVMADVRNANILHYTNQEGRLSTLQYTVSNQGSLQLILNRFIYYLKHTNRDKSRQWRCVDYLNSCRCPAHVITKDDVVVQRISAHKHPFHDKKILKKVTTHTVFSAISDAEHEGNNMKNRQEEEKLSES